MTDIAEIQKHKVQLQADITSLLREFEKAADGLVVCENIRIERTNNMDGSSQVCFVVVDVALK